MASSHHANNIIIDFEVPKHLHSIIVGKGGQTIKNLHKETGAFITVPKHEDSSQKVEVEGTKETLEKAKQAIEHLLGIEISPDPLEIIVGEVPKNKIHNIIGHSGSTIKHLQEQHRVHIHIPKDSSTLTIEGVKANVDRARAAIEELVGQKLHVKVNEIASAPIHTLYDTLEKVDFEKPRILETLFFPDDNTGAKLTRLLQYLLSAKNTLDVCVYTITDDRISNSLIEAKKRGVFVRIITDDDQSKTLGSDVERMKEHGIEIRMDNSPSNMHNKFAIADHKVVLNGSFNWTRAASTANRENVVISNEKELVDAFENEFEKLWKLYEGNV